MVARAATPCRKPACAGLCRDGTGYCAEHKGESWARHQRGRTRQERGYGQRWEIARRTALHRDRYLCVYCGAVGRHTAATEVDHRIPKAAGGTDDLHNLASTCRACHASKTAHEGQAGRG